MVDDFSSDDYGSWSGDTGGSSGGDAAPAKNKDITAIGKGLAAAGKSMGGGSAKPTVHVQVSMPEVQAAPPPASVPIPKFHKGGTIKKSGVQVINAKKGERILTKEQADNYDILKGKKKPTGKVELRLVGKGTGKRAAAKAASKRAKG